MSDRLRRAAPVPADKARGAGKAATYCVTAVWMDKALTGGMAVPPCAGAAGTKADGKTVRFLLYCAPVLVRAPEKGYNIMNVLR